MIQRTIRMQEFLKCNISQLTWVMKLKFCMWLDINRSKSSHGYLNWVLSDMSEHTQCDTKLMVRFISRMSWALKLFLLHVVLHPQKLQLIRSFQMDVVTHSHIGSKQGVSYIWRMNWGMKLILCFWLSIYKYIYLLQYIHMGVVRHTWACQGNSWYWICQDWIELWCIFFAYAVIIHRSNKSIQSFQVV